MKTKTYIVSVSRVAYQDFIVKAANKKQAMDKAADLAFNSDGWNSAYAEYKMKTPEEKE